MPPDPHNFTQLMSRAQAGDRAATEELFPLVYAELRSLAERQLKGERANHTLQPTALVHEAYMRLVGSGGESDGWEGRAHFFGAAARAIRRILTDHARTKNRVKRGGGAKAASLDSIEVAADGDDQQDFVALDAALEKLAKLDDQKAKVVELRFFAGLTVEQTAAAMGVSESTVARDWQFARVWLHRELGSSQGA